MIPDPIVDDVSVVQCDADGTPTPTSDPAGAYVVFVDHGSAPAPEFVSALRSYEGADVLYGDEIDNSAAGDGIVRLPHASPERLRCQYHWGSVVAYRREFLESIGGVDVSLGPVALYELALRATRAGAVVEHADEVVASRPGGPRLGRLGSDHLDMVRTVLERHLGLTGGGEVVAVHEDGIHDTRRRVDGRPLVSIVIPTQGLWSDGSTGRHSYLLEAVASILEKTSYDEYELVVVHDDAEEEILDELRRMAGDRLVLVHWRRPFNFSGKINLGVLHARGEFVLILNDDVEVITPAWIEPMLALAQRPGAGLVGCMLYYDDDTVQHAGHHYWRGDAKHIGMFFPRGVAGPVDGFRVEREVVGVTAACALMRRDLYLELGGMTELLPSAFNDVDLCMKSNVAGRTSYWTPHAELYHFESKSRDPSVRRWEVDVAWGRWASRMHAPEYWPYPD